MNKPFFSVVIPTYNRAGFIGKTIQSVLDQDFSDFEIIVVDDGSTDNTEEVVRSIADSRLRYHRQVNSERGAARNTGAAISSGDYITFLDSDDLLYPAHLSVANEIAEQHRRPEWFHSGYEFIDAEGNISAAVNNLPATANDRLVDGNFLSCRGVFLRRDIAEKHPFNTDRRLSGTEDYELWLRLAARYPLYCDNRVTSAMVEHDQRSVVNTGREELENRIRLLEESLADDPAFSDSYSGSLSSFKANNRVYIALHLALTKRHRVAAVGYLFKAFFCSPAALRNRAFYGTLKRLVF